MAPRPDPYRTSPSTPELASAAPPQFDGPEGSSAAGTLRTATVARCLILSFRAVRRTEKLERDYLECTVDAVLEGVEGVTQYSGFKTYAMSTAPPGTDAGEARRLLEGAERGGLVANSLRGARTPKIRALTNPDSL